MLFIGLISADQTLCRAIGEQIKAASDWQLATFSALDDALGVWSNRLPPLIFWDVETVPATEELVSYFHSCLTQLRPAPLLLILGTPAEELDLFGVTEKFTRPLRLGYLLGRLQFYQRILGQSPDVQVALGSWFFVPRAHQLTAKTKVGEPVKLTEKESALLEFLITASNPVPREELLAAVWGYDGRVDTHTLETHIYRLRKKVMVNNPDGPDLFLVIDGAYQVNPLWLAL